jgi:hypothetical protein
MASREDCWCWLCASNFCQVSESFYLFARDAEGEDEGDDADDDKDNDDFAVVILRTGHPDTAYAKV